MYKKYNSTILIALIVSGYTSLISFDRIKTSVSGKMYNWSQPSSSTITRYGLSFKNKSNQDIFLVVENASLSRSEAKFGSLRYFSANGGQSLATTPVFKAGSAITPQQAKKQGLNVYDQDGNYTGQYWEGVNIDMDINQPTMLSIYTYNRATPAINLPKTTVLNGQEIIRAMIPNAQLIYKATFKPGKTLYIKWDGKKLSPQAGGVAGKTDAGFSTKMNVTQKDIQPL